MNLCDPALQMDADKGVYICKRSNDAAEVYFVCNDNETDARVALDAVPGMKVLDPATGEEKSCRVKDGRVYLTLAGLEMLAVIVV